MQKFFMALILLSNLVSTSALAHSGTEQEEKACTRDGSVSAASLWIKVILPFWPASRKIVQSSL